MFNSTGRYVLGCEVVTPTGMNLNVATAVSKADLGLFDQYNIHGGVERFSFTKIEYTQSQDPFEKVCELTSIILDSLLLQMPRVLKPAPLMISVPSSIPLLKMQKWLEESTYADFISLIEVFHVSGPQFLIQTLKALDKYDALMCISLDSMVESLEQLIEQQKVVSTYNPWGLIPSEGGAGLILGRRNIIETLRLKPKAEISYLDTEIETQDRRGMFRLVQRAAKKLASFGEPYTDMSNLRDHSEDYGFALGAKAERFINPEEPTLINELWGTMGSGSTLALVGFAAQYHQGHHPASLLTFDPSGDKAFIQLRAM
ncbi:hypothetical protein [Vibrio sagamiensis]|uniref:Beta-ketoacyl synthase N-terminal domain-containing protein n=1 Tax=Vibrio sagamiensis NBRC 104589 TaxID=1219064 RepID=A0A511QCX6_9VIBR|nr:hypothetical protein [Vibrio sagamiensis]PNQ55639.1 hypothetical protein C1141_14140 [Vibrio agarivorans]GEM75143.1 hypothetical protein VSA01S_12550 [Vibrio sagamiensis NBRC 104589]